MGFTRGQHTQKLVRAQISRSDADRGSDIMAKNMIPTPFISTNTMRQPGFVDGNVHIFRYYH